MQAIGKIVLGAAALGVAYLISRDDIEVGSDGIQRFKPDARKKVNSILVRSGLTDAPSSAIPGTFAMTVVPGGAANPEMPNTTKFVNGITADGTMKILITKNVLNEKALHALQTVLMPVGNDQVFDAAKKGSDLVLL